MDKIREHYAYRGSNIYTAHGVIRLADGSLSAPHKLFRFRSLAPEALKDGGLLRIAQALEAKTLAGFENSGDEHVDRVELS